MKISKNPHLLNDKNGQTFLPLKDVGTFVFRMNLEKEFKEYRANDFYAMASTETESWEVECPEIKVVDGIGMFFNPETQKMQTV